MYTTQHFVAQIKLDDYIREYRDSPRFIVYCKACDRYNSCWACPPFDFDADDYIAPYEMAYIIGSKITLNNDIIADNQGWEKCTPMSYEIIEEVRRELDEKLIKIENEYPASRAFFAGTCHLCPKGECTKTYGKPCVLPERVRPSLEAFGFDIGKTSSELLHIEMKWSLNGIMPEYFTLVSGLFAKNKIQNISSLIK